MLTLMSIPRKTFDNGVFYKWGLRYYTPFFHLKLLLIMDMVFVISASDYTIQFLIYYLLEYFDGD